MISNEGLRFITDGLAENSTLESLSVSCNDINSDGVRYLVKVLKTSKLKELDLS